MFSFSHKNYNNHKSVSAFEMVHLIVPLPPFPTLEIVSTPLFIFFNFLSITWLTNTCLYLLGTTTMALNESCRNAEFGKSTIFVPLLHIA